MVWAAFEPGEPAGGGPGMMVVAFDQHRAHFLPSSLPTFSPPLLFNWNAFKRGLIHQHDLPGP